MKLFGLIVNKNNKIENAITIKFL